MQKEHVILILFSSLFNIGYLTQFNVLNQYVFARLLQEKNITEQHNQTACEHYSISNKTAVDSVRQEASQVDIYSQISSGISGLIFVIFYSACSDRFGRKKLLFLGWISGLVVMLINLIMVILNLPFWWMYISGVISGIGGTYGVLIAAAFGYIADTSSPGKRNLAIALLESSLGIALFTGNLLVGFLIKSNGYVTTFSVITGILFISIALLFFLPESVANCQSPDVIDRPLRKLIPFVRDSLISFFSFSKYRTKLIVFAVLAFGSNYMAYMGALSLNTNYELSYPFCWHSDNIGVYNAVNVSVGMVSITVLIYFLKKFVSDTLLVFLGSCSFVLAKIVFGVGSLTTRPSCIVILYIALVIDFASRVVPIILRSILSKSVSPEEQGLLFGIFSFTQTLVGMIGAVIYNYIYQNTLFLWSGIVFICMGLTALFGVLPFVFFKICCHEQSDIDMNVIINDTDNSEELIAKS